MAKREYINLLSGDTLPAYALLQEHFKRANDRELSIGFLRDCFMQGFRENDADLILKFYRDIKKRTESDKLFLHKQGETPMVLFGELGWENTGVDMPMQYLDDPSVITSRVVMDILVLPQYFTQDIRAYADGLQSRLNGGG